MSNLSDVRARAIVPDAPPENDEWKQRAACRDTDPAIFYPQGSGDSAVNLARIRAFCDECPVRAECLAMGVYFTERGYWGGLNEKARQALRRRLGIRPITRSLAPLTTSPVRCATAEGYSRHLRAGESPCDTCRDAHAARCAWDKSRRRVEMRLGAR